MDVGFGQQLILKFLNQTRSANETFTLASKTATIKTPLMSKVASRLIENSAQQARGITHYVQSGSEVMPQCLLVPWRKLPTSIARTGDTR